MTFRMVNVGGRAALADKGFFYDLESVSAGSCGPDPMQAIANTDILHTLATRLPQATPTGLLDEVTLGPPVPRAPKSFVIGLNYVDHSAEIQARIPEVPLVYTKFPSAITGPCAEVELRSDSCDYEGELLVVIGAGGRDIPQQQAWQRVAGLAVGQDFSDRDAQFMGRPPAMNLGKSFDTHGPIGPAVVSVDAVDDPDDLELSTWVNGERRQHDRTSNMIFGVPYLVAFLSRICTLSPGDVIFTGTPAGVGFATKTFLRDGDVVTTRIEGLGELRNRCVRGPDWR